MTEIKMPSDRDAEIFVLGSTIGDAYAASQVCNTLTSDDFYFIETKRIFQAISSLKDDNFKIDADKLIFTLKEDPLFKNQEILHSLIQFIDVSGKCIDVDFYLDEIKRLSTARALLYSCKNTIDMVHSSPPSDISKILYQTQKNLSNLGHLETKDFISSKALTENFFNGMNFEEYFLDRMEKSREGIDTFDGFRTGYKNLDSIIGGFGNGTNNIIGARSSTGKTTLLINLFLNIHRQYPDAHIGFLSLEMSNKRIREKFVCTIAGVPFNSYEDGNISQMEIEAILETSKMLSDYNLSCYDHPGLSISLARNLMRRKALGDKIDILFVDYLTLIQSDYRALNKHLQIDEISKGLQSLAKELNIPIVTLSQLNRQSATRQDKSPVITDLRESGSIEEDADTVLLLHRPAQYDATKTDNTEIIVAKNRNRGTLGKTSLSYSRGLLTELDPIEKMRPADVIAGRPDPRTQPWER